MNELETAMTISVSLLSFFFGAVAGAAAMEFVWKRNASLASSLKCGPQGYKVLTEEAWLDLCKRRGVVL